MNHYDDSILAACDVFHHIKETYEFSDEDINESDYLYLIQKKDAVDELENYVLTHANEAPVRTLIDRFIYQMKIYCATSNRESEAYDLFRIRKETAEEILIYFL